MPTILEKIVEQTRYDLEKRKRKVSFGDFESFEGFEKYRLSLADSIRTDGSVSVIAEVKKASPSKGEIRKDFKPVPIAESYMESGASAISVLTDEPFFKGSLQYLENISRHCTIPLLRKDFIVDPYQVKEAAAYGADAVLLIATICNGNQLSELLASSREFGLQALVECYHSEEMENLDWEQVEVVGVNNRNLATFQVDLHRGVEMLQQAPEHVVRVSESGIHKPEDLLKLLKNGIHSALIGEYFMKQPDPGNALREMLNQFTELKINHEYN